jgi:short subunit dehydrogenase-like uncharacterized protein
MASESTGPVAVYGATGYTGRLVAAELLRRGAEAVLVGRNPAKLEIVAFEPREFLSAVGLEPDVFAVPAT